MKIKNILTTCLLVSTLGFCSHVSAVRVYDCLGGRFLTSGQDSETLSINVGESDGKLGPVNLLTELVFNEIAAQAKKDGYKYILLNDDVLLGQRTAQKLARNFLTVAYDDFYSADASVSNDALFNGGVTLKDMKRWVADKVFKNVYPYPFIRPYLILPADNLVPSMLVDIYVNRDYSSIGTTSDKYLACREYYRTCDRHFLD